MTRYRIIYEERISDAVLIDAPDPDAAYRAFWRGYKEDNLRNAWHESSGPVNVQVLEVK